MFMARFSDRLRELRNAKDLSQSDFAKQLGISKSSVNMYERGEREPNFKMLEQIADYFNVDMDYLLGKSNIRSKNDIDKYLLPLPPMKEWKVIGGTACGSPLHRELEETIMAPANIDADRVFRCVGDSMIGAHIFDGDLVFVKTGEFVEDGRIGVVRIEDEYTLKRIYRGENYLELRSENPKYPPIIIRGEQENAEIVGKAVQFLSRVI